jgi:hypothetical protein
MRLSANNCFNQSINLLHTILYGYKSWKKKIQQEFTLPDNWNTDLKWLKEKHKIFLKNIRHKAVNHKELSLQQLNWWFYNKINTAAILATREIIDDLKFYINQTYHYWDTSTTKNNIITWFNSIVASLEI